MYREANRELELWRESPRRKPLIVKGARQVGKTWLVKHFGEQYYDRVVYVNFDHDKSAHEIFEADYDMERIIKRLAIHAEMDIEPGNTLIFLDEIQACPRALESLKYFCEEAPEYHIIVAGSLLGIYLHEHVSFPVGKVDFMTLHPLCFTEFLAAMGEQRLAEAIIAREYELIAPFHEKLVDLYKTYLITGGMPEAVKGYIETKSFATVKQIQGNIIEAFERDFSKHAPVNDTQRIAEIFEAVPSLLAKENKKFMFGAVRPSARAREYESALSWLLSASLVKKVLRVNKVATPLAAYSDRNVFKLFYLDVGLLGFKAGLRPEAVYDNSAFLEEFKGALAEQFVLQELEAHGAGVYYYSKDDSRVELDFIIDTSEGPLPIEVKSGKSLTSKSFAAFMKENAGLSKAVKFSLLPYEKHEKISNLPLYFAGTVMV